LKIERNPADLNPSPLVSVVLPTYNGSRYLNESIRSVVGQTYRNWELIIVDDASSDTTPQIIAEWSRGDSRIRSLRNEHNLKLPGSLNQGFDIARGEFLTWTSDDNLYRATALQEMLEFLLNHRSLGLVYTDFSDIDEHGRVIEEIHAGEPSALTERNCVRACFMYPVEVRRRIGNYNERKFLVEDWEYWIRIARHFPLACLHRDLYQYRWHPGSLTAMRKTEIDEAVRNLLRSNLPEMKWAGRRALASGYLKLTDLAEDAGNHEESLKFFKTALRYAPVWSVRQARRKMIELIFGKTMAACLGVLIRTLTPRRANVTQKLPPPFRQDPTSDSNP
jgi:glycosyltransferase involved in cell wall biosynthesis